MIAAFAPAVTTALVTLLAASAVGAPAPRPPSGLATPAHAAYAACTGKARTNPDFEACGVAYVKAADVALNVAWQRAQAALQPASRSELVKEERAWLAFRDASCSVYASGEFGREGEVIGFFACRGHVVEARTADLEELANGGT